MIRLEKLSRKLAPALAILYAFGAVILVVSFRYGKLSVLYPVVSMSFIWVAILSSIILDESVSSINWFGIFFIVLGVSFIGRGAAT